MRYRIAIETGDKKHAYGVVVPDLPGCFSAGDTLEEAMTNAREAILLHMEGLLEDQEALPKPSPIAVLRRKRDYKGWTWAVIDVDLSELGEKATRINVSLPQRVLRAIDLHARRSGETRSGFLARAAIDAMRESTATPTATRAAK
jgi:predicted RNase H-like HicB family nuclease